MFDDKLEMVATKKAILSIELFDSHNQTLLTSSSQCSDHLQLDEVDMNPDDGLPLVEGGKRDADVRRQVLVVQIGLVEKLVDQILDQILAKTSFTRAWELLGSNFGKEVVYEVATEGAGGILYLTLDNKLNELYEAIAFRHIT
ncbi:pumilio-like protein 24 [Pyrus ussuriensis x Pyrus communis]|uniref:Pumilio-like protein 24 n=1 Tax=Pyrus ussuriensis x Pyrus communis TaxID=2448454 RepID=A0A5N5HRS8_9ROSA|nr:pumilio-like protein 24 [Pyrus ussuriensis x Pyrus communis]